MKEILKNLAVGISAAIPAVAVLALFAWVLVNHPAWIVVPALVAGLLMACWGLGYSIRTRNGQKRGGGGKTAW